MDYDALAVLKGAGDTRDHEAAPAERFALPYCVLRSGLGLPVSQQATKAIRGQAKGWGAGGLAPSLPHLPWPRLSQ